MPNTENVLDLMPWQLNKIKKTNERPKHKMEISCSIKRSDNILAGRLAGHLGYFVGSTLFVPFTSKRCGDGVNFSWCSFYVILYYHVFICMHTLYAVVFYFSVFFIILFYGSGLTLYYQRTRYIFTNIQTFEHGKWEKQRDNAIMAIMMFKKM